MGKPLIDRDALMQILTDEIACQARAVAEATGHTATQKRAEARARTAELKRVADRVSKMPVQYADEVHDDPAPPRAEWSDRVSLAIALSESKPAARTACQRLLHDLGKPVSFLQNQFAAEHHARRTEQLRIKNRAMTNEQLAAEYKRAVTLVEINEVQAEIERRGRIGMEIPNV